LLGSGCVFFDAFFTHVNSGVTPQQERVWRQSALYPFHTRSIPVPYQSRSFSGKKQWGDKGKKGKKVLAEEGGSPIIY